MTLTAPSTTPSTHARVVPIYSTHTGNQAYLEMFQTPKGTVHVRTIAGDNRHLNKFWRMWLRHLLLTKTDPQHHVWVVLEDDGVTMGWNRTSDGLGIAAYNLAAEIHPLHNKPLKAYIAAKARPKKKRVWMVVERDGASFDPNTVASNIALPDGASITVTTGEQAPRQDGQTYITLLRKRKCKMEMEDLAMLVEYHFAMAALIARS